MIWRPTVFGPTGIPVTPQAPPALRVEGGAEITAQQRTMAQQAFANFSMQARLARYTNQVTAGRLPDGSPYRIAVVGPQTIMQVWPVGEEDEIRGGIGIVLTDLAGGLLPGHILVGEGGEQQAQPYILTPVEKKGTRNSTGKWKVRKAAFNGGKASFYDPKSKKYLMGMDGSPDGLLPPPPGNSDMAGVNTRANRIGFRIDGTPFYAGKREDAAGAFRSEYDMLPFFRRNAAGQLCWVHIVPEFLFGTRLKMFAGLYEPAPAAYVGELVDTFEMPADYTLNYQTISPSPDGNTLRMVFRRASNSAFVAVDMAVSDTSLGVTSMVEYFATVPGSANTTVEGTIPTGRTTTITTIGGKSVGLEYGYDGKGQPVVVRPGTTFADTVGVRFDQTTGNTVGDLLTEITTANTNNFTRHATSGMLVNGVDVTFPRPTTTTSNTSTTTTVTDVPTGALVSFAVEGAGTINSTNYTALLTLISDPVTQFIVQASNLRHFTQTSHLVAVNTGSVWTVETVIDSESETFEPVIEVMAKGVLVDRITTGPFDIGKFAATIAADPVTGAICCNVLEFTDDSRNFVANSWIYVADDTGGRRLSQIMAVADSRDIRIRNDSSLLSV